MVGEGFVARLVALSSSFREVSLLGDENGCEQRLIEMFGKYRRKTRAISRASVEILDTDPAIGHRAVFPFGINEIDVVVWVAIGECGVGDVELSS